MSNEIAKEVITTKEGKKVDIPAEAMLECYDDVTNMVRGHQMILSAVGSILHKLVDAGLAHNDAASVAMELQRRASAKANELVGHDGKEKDKEDEENGKKEDTEESEAEKA